MNAINTLTLTNQLYIVHCAYIFPQAQHAQSMKLIWRPLDLILVVLLLAAMAFTVLRGLVSVHHMRVWSEAVSYGSFIWPSIHSCSRTDVGPGTTEHFEYISI